MHYSAVPALLAASAVLATDPKQAVVSAFVSPSAHIHVPVPKILFQSRNGGHPRPNQHRCTYSLLKADHSSSGGGDQLRASTGIRPSLHPTTINAISEALLLRHSAKNNKPIDVWADSDDDGDAAQPLDVAVTAGAIASDLLEKRKTSCEADGDVSSIPTPEECQTVAGRVVGVVMRLRPLEMELAKRVNGAKWVAKYGEHGSFGVLKSECKQAASAAAAAAANEDEGEGGETSSSDVKSEIDAKIEKELTDRIRDDPLFRMCRAECLLAIFLDTVEAPKWQEVGASVPGGSSVDFIDEDRREVILS